MRVLGIESSCDETAAAIVDEHGVVYADVVASQIAEHAPYGGVVPELASRAHMRAIVPVVRSALREGGDYDAIAVTNGPGLVGALLVGVQFAKALAFGRDLPLIGVSHLDGHLFAAFLRRDDTKVPSLPFIALLVSGGHTALYEVRSLDDVAQLAQTRDDAAGEAYDKVAKLLGLGYPGGPVVDRLAQRGDPRAVALPTPFGGKKTLEFSFSGLKTAVAQHVRNHPPRSEDDVANVCASFQRIVVESLAQRGIAACQQRSIPRLVITGGVAANRGLRARAAELAAQANIELFVPPFASCTDNAAMIAYVGAQHLLAGRRDDLTLAAYSRDPRLVRGKILGA